MRSLLMAAILVAVTAAVAGCSSSSACPAGGSGDVKVVEIHVGSSPGDKMYQNPSTITVNKCDKVRFSVHNDDSIFHDVALLDYDGSDIEHEVQPGQTVVTHHDGKDYFVATVTGTFTVKCEVSGHAGKGMTGTLVVN